MDDFLIGGIAATSAFAGLVFLRFWVQTRDRFFLYFAWSLWIEAAHRVVLGLYPDITESNPVSYVVRIIAYGLIILAIIHKNRRQTPK